MIKTKRGKILRVKLGYNPNSSSIGSVVFAIPTMLLTTSVIFGTVTGIIFSRFLKKSKKNHINDESVTKE